MAVSLALSARCSHFISAVSRPAAAPKSGRHSGRLPSRRKIEFLHKLYGPKPMWQILSVIPFNIVRGFQLLTVTERRSPGRKRRTACRFETAHTLRYLYLHRAGVIVRPDGYATLDVGNSPAVIDRFRRLDRLLKAA